MESLVRSYGEAWQAMDIPKLVGLLTEDVLLTMPPLPLWLTGRDAAVEFFSRLPVGGKDRFRIIPTHANFQPALAVYRRETHNDQHRAWGIWVLTTDGPAIAEVAAFVDPALVLTFGLPAELS